MGFIEYAWNTHYLRAIVIFIIAFIVMQITLFIFERILLRAAKRTKTVVDDLIVEKCRKPSALLILLVGIRLAVEALILPNPVSVGIERAVSSIIILMLVHIAVTVLTILIDNWGQKIVSSTKSTVDNDILNMFHRFSKIAFYGLGIMYVLTVWGIEIGPLIASLGIAGLAVALAIKPTLENIFGGVTLIADKVLRVGDVVELEDGSLGKIQKVSLRSTRIKTFDNELITIPNGSLSNSKITNWYMPNKKVRITINFGVEYGSKPEKVKKLVMGLIKKDKGILKDPSPYVHFTDMGDSSINFMARFWIDDISTKLETKDRMVTTIYNELGKSKIGIPFPTRTVYVKNKK